MRMSLSTVKRRGLIFRIKRDWAKAQTIDLARLSLPVAAAAKTAHNRGRPPSNVIWSLTQLN